MNRKTLWYVADPMCSWCWGFSPVVEAIRREYRDRLGMELLLGGLRPGTRHALPAAQREEILHHWHAVRQATGQPFQFEGALPPGFIYDTEPASRAVVAASLLHPGEVFAFFRSVQSAFYAAQRNVTDPAVLMQLAEEVGLDAQHFSRLLDSDTARDLTQDHFQRARQWGIQSFPTLVAQDGSDHAVLARGYLSFEALRPALDAWLA
ncbi:DsbA family protein [Nitrosovibrio sp. Nv17]|uniref:DsbA family protein n=1 Tax=Nitrosovibrio sp. Nv17 TaxID=1855339 RepID=UPI0009090A7A|nr:DsbA family protein [Nitrosovibrio sp. Nv17]SFW20999.1 putative protein-disulfide isomerase [Nitrosovibrio sp. Nv17]